MKCEVPIEVNASIPSVESEISPRRTRLARAVQPPANDLHRSVFLTPAEAADLLRTTRKAIYSMIERGQLAGVRRLGRRVLIHRGELLDSLEHNRTSSPQENRR